MDIPLDIVLAIRTHNLNNPRPEEPVATIKKIKNNSVSGDHKNSNNKVTGSTNVKPASKNNVTASGKRDPRMPKPNQHKQNGTNRKDETPKRPPAPIKWRTRNIANGTHAGGTLLWAYKRNYKVELIDSAHGVFPYTVTEITDPQKPKPVLKVTTGGFKDIDEAKVRCETIIRILGRGLDLRLTDNEKENGEYIKENCKFVEYEAIIPKTTEVERVNDAATERNLKEQLAAMGIS